MNNEIEEVQGGLKSQRYAVGKALEYHRACISDAHNNYVLVRQQYLQCFQTACRNNENETSFESEIETFDDAERKLWVYLCSVYQQDKSLPTLNHSLQLGPPYSFSKLTHYIRILYF